MSDKITVAITHVPASVRYASKAEVCEHKGIGHPDSICDGVAEAVSRALSQSYLRVYGAIQHHNVDKALLIAGQSSPRFGGGRITIPARLIVCGRASTVPDMEDVIRSAAHDYLKTNLHCATDAFAIEPMVRETSANLREVFSRSRSHVLANDTSFGAGYAPYSALERKVLDLARIMRSGEFRSRFPCAGDDYKIMGFRVGSQFRFTVALAFIDREITSAAKYFEVKREVTRFLEQAVNISGAIDLNMLDDPRASTENGIYLTVTGLSAEHGDDGQVGRGNRVNGLITPFHTMSLEAAAGKNPVAHVGKLYNLLAMEIAGAICCEIRIVQEASVQILSTIGRPITEPQMISIQAVAARKLDSGTIRQIEDVARSRLNGIEQISQRLVAGDLKVF